MCSLSQVWMEILSFCRTLLVKKEAENVYKTFLYWEPW
jgi:hypothetical protein